MRGGGNMNKMMKQMQKMQKDMMKAQEELQEMSFEATAGGGMVKVVANGNKVITDIEINEEVVDPDDVEMLQDLVLAATNDVLKQVDEKSNDTMGQFTKGMNLPGGMF
ncbi:nucleoid-associated protein [Paraliobacillus quinghaiensis]|uniref:Nucleoid-associated protein GCM10011351_31320 n=1 Tax=Paraliobacillus quinghaiensis TaxID=470815 RepID=A0A917WYZ5_9BACI|nr:YbaB/EbfC family nucleoid-associated protein [Paraliobacillus quinghaiensis]GGM43098.1 nucleoid-associated protein [Paraliobacillus quinghaiensis]